jgi:hypothetical protein
MTANPTRETQTSSIGATITLLVVLIAATAAGATGAASAQEISVEPANQTDEQAEQREGTLGDLIIRSSEQTSGETGEIVVEWTGETPTTLRHTQLDIESEQIAAADTRLLPGESIRWTVQLVSDDPSLLWTEESVADNQIHVVRWSESGTSRSVPLWQGVAFGAGTFALATVLMAFRKLNTYGDPQEGWE